MEPIVPVSWQIPDNTPATSAQRRSLYRLGYGRSLVKKLTAQQADAAIKGGLRLHDLIHQADKVIA